MADLSPALSTVQSTLDDTTARVAELAGRAEADGREEVALGLWEVERSLRTGLRRLESLSRSL